MDVRGIKDLFEQSPIIAAVKSEELLQKALESECMMVFILYGSICTIDAIVDQVKARGKIAIVHTDLVAGLAGKDPVGAEFIRRHTKADGIISTKQQMVRRAKELGLIAGERTFMIDSMAFATVTQHLATCRPDFLEIMPGVATTIIHELHEMTDVPLVAGGLIRNKTDILRALDGGACAISTTKAELWAL
ncbi:MAG: glycerol-3-phosphate responsive antiterminator [Sphaerochaeta sp.]|jgi:glycerol-3-phosphate responsive antiterminator|nr:glycerol-3-phosphate responsive antiterminator [Sphaerochaeta sp.]MCH3908695.1 glycerol-3-phosphate responsive antiterminator [Sphaerochaeta sp.]MCH3921055.1 glycerol-3-phosphate responsive antiterminator [Sphaerochaeta sp.]MCI2046031.1 glycerol-3-phosphate responsive antiterminator [Sphaerochaeta sp.]MCI2076987.1 glycerol-3-phosphate responsive antiterminator [Sphaerochaeta sp.]